MQPMATIVSVVEKQTNENLKILPDRYHIIMDFIFIGGKKPAVGLAFIIFAKYYPISVEL